MEKVSPCNIKILIKIFSSFAFILNSKLIPEVKRFFSTENFKIFQIRSCNSEKLHKESDHKAIKVTSYEYTFTLQKANLPFFSLLLHNNAIEIHNNAFFYATGDGALATAEEEKGSSHKR